MDYCSHISPFSFVSNFIMPYCLEALSSKTGFVFGSVSVLSILFIYFCVPECRGKTLEQIDRMFQEGVPLRHFANYSSSDFTIAETKEGKADLVEVVGPNKTTGVPV